MKMALSDRIIEEVKLYKILYNMYHPQYKNTRKKNETWDKIGKSLGADGDDVKKKWKNLRDSYAKHIRSEKNRLGKKAKSIDRYKTWPWAQQMSFFKPFLQVTKSNVSNDVTSDVQIEDKSDLVTDVPEEQIQSNSKTLAKKQCAIKSESSRPSGPVDKVSCHLGSKTSDEDSNEIDLLFRGYAKTVKKFSTRRQTLVKYEIAKMLMEQEIQQLNEDEAAVTSRHNST